MLDSAYRPERAIVPPRRIAVLAHASVLDSSGYARRAVGSAVALARALPQATVVLWSVESPRRRAREDAIGEVQAACREGGVSLRIVPAPPRRLGLAALSDGLVARRLAREWRRDAAEAVHAHGPRALRAALRARTKRALRVVADVHGDRAAEAHLERGGAARGAAFARDAVDVAAADGVVHASEPLAERFPAGAGRPSAVVPCLVADEEIPSDDDAERGRTARRARLGLSEAEWVGGYAGSLAPWQEAPRLAAIVRHLVDRVPQFRMLVLTPDPAGVRALFDEAGVPRDRAIATSVPPGDVVPSLLAADAGILLRRPAAANAVAFPTKFAEYLAAGLEVVASDAVPAVAGRIAASAGLGHVLSWEKDDASWAARLAGASRPSTAAERSARRAWVRANLAWSTALPAYRRVYESMGTEA